MNLMDKRYWPRWPDGWDSCPWGWYASLFGKACPKHGEDCR